MNVYKTVLTGKVGAVQKFLYSCVFPGEQFYFFVDN